MTQSSTSGYGTAVVGALLGAVPTAMLLGVAGSSVGATFGLVGAGFGLWAGACIGSAVRLRQNGVRDAVGTGVAVGVVLAALVGMLRWLQSLRIGRVTALLPGDAAGVEHLALGLTMIGVGVPVIAAAAITARALAHAAWPAVARRGRRGKSLAAVATLSALLPIAAVAHVVNQHRPERLERLGQAQFEATDRTRTMAMARAEELLLFTRTVAHNGALAAALRAHDAPAVEQAIAGIRPPDPRKVMGDALLAADDLTVTDSSGRAVGTARHQTIPEAKAAMHSGDLLTIRTQPAAIVAASPVGKDGAVVTTLRIDHFAHVVGGEYLALEAGYYMNGTRIYPPSSGTRLPDRYDAQSAVPYMHKEGGAVVSTQFIRFYVPAAPALAKSAWIAVSVFAEPYLPRNDWWWIPVALLFAALMAGAAAVACRPNGGPANAAADVARTGPAA